MILDTTHTGWGQLGWQNKNCSNCHSIPPTASHDSSWGAGNNYSVCANCHGGNGACDPNASTRAHDPADDCTGSGCHNATMHGYSVNSDCVNCHLASGGLIACGGVVHRPQIRTCPIRACGSSRACHQKLGCVDEALADFHLTSAPQQLTRRSSALTPQVARSPAPIVVKVPSGGDAWPLTSQPQQSTVPSVWMPQVWALPPARAVKVPSGGDAWPSSSQPQQATVPSARMPQLCWSLVAIAVKVPAGATPGR